MHNDNDDLRLLESNDVYCQGFSLLSHIRTKLKASTRMHSGWKALSTNNNKKEVSGVSAQHSSRYKKAT
jgi:uncharacterized protein YcbK (DUF882 family)